MGAVAVGTIVSKNFLAHTRVLVDSFRRFHPDIPFFLALADETDGCFAPERESFRVLNLVDLGIPRLNAFRFGYSRQQVVIGAKPYLLRHMLDRGFHSAIFLDADMLILADLCELLEKVGHHAVSLTPHLLDPLAGDRRSSRELNILVSGTYNGGFVGMSDTPATRRFLAWWEERLWDHCEHDVAEGMHYDQRWLDFAPSFVEDAVVLRDPGYNVAYWNLPERELKAAASGYTANGRPCRWFHLSGYDADDPDQVTKYRPDLHMDQIGDAAAIFRQYVALLNDAGYQQTKTWPYTYDRFDDGTSIPDAARRLYRESGEAAGRFDDPFQATQTGSFADWLNESPEKNGVTRLWRAIYQERPDVQRAFPNISGANRRAFLRWTVKFGSREHGVAPRFLTG